MDARKFGLPTVLGLVIAAIGVLTPIVWDRYQTKSTLELRSTSATTVVQVSDELEQLHISYAGTPISTLTRLQFSLVNSGRRPIRGADLISPPKISLLNDARLLDFQIERLDPTDLELEVHLDTANAAVELRFPLLNPGDVIEFSILAAGESPLFDVRARIVGISKIDVVSVADDRRTIPWTVWPVGAFTLLLTLVLLIFLTGLGKELQIRDLFRADALSIPSGAMRGWYRNHIETMLESKTDTELKAVYAVIDRLPENSAITEDEIQPLRQAVGRAVGDVSTIWSALVFVVVLVGVGWWFLGTRLF